MRRIFILGVLLVSFMGCAHQDKTSTSLKVLAVNDVNWEKLNPARGDKSPQAGTLWGDRKAAVETGFLAKFVDGFSSPPHIHNASYRAIVIEGLIHNDDANAAKMWMPKGSYWTQPKGEAHITAAKGSHNFALVEIDKGPYLVKPIDKSFDSSQRPYNIHASNIIWRNQGSYDVVNLWKNSLNIVTGSLLRFQDRLSIDVSSARLVVISGDLGFNEQVLKPGSLITESKSSTLNLTCKSSECIFYLKTTNKFSAQN